MSNYTDFVSMTNAEAKSYLCDFLREMTPSLDRFSTSVDCELTYSPESLEQVWNSMLPALDWRAGYVPPDLGQPGPRIAEADLEPAQDLPSWFHHPSGAGYARFTAETLWLIDGAARYLGETVIRNVGGRWASGNVQIKNYVHENQPVLADLTADPLSPMQTCAVLAARALRQNSEQGPHTLTHVYDGWRRQATEQ